MASSCETYEVLMEVPTGVIDYTITGIAFFIGIVVGLIAGAAITYIILRWWKKKKEAEDVEAPDEEDDDMEEEVEKVDESSTKLMFNIDTGGKKKKKKKIQKKGPEEKRINLEDFGIIPTSAFYDEDDQHGSTRVTALPGKRGLMDALIKPNGESMDMELASQELDMIMLLDKEIKDGKILNVNQLIKMLLAHFAQNGALSPEFYREFADEVRNTIAGILRQIQDEELEEERKLEEDAKLRNDAAAMESAKEELRAKYSRKMDSLLNEEQQNMRMKLLKRTELSESDIDSALEKLNAGNTAFEQKTNEHLLQQRRTLEERVMRRKMIAEMRQNKQNEDEEQIAAATAHYQDTCDRLVSDGLLVDRQAKEIMDEYQQSVNNVQSSYSQEIARQMELLSVKFHQRRAQRLGELENELKAETEDLMAAFDGKTDMSAYIKSFNAMKEEHQERRDNLIDELDQLELVENGKMKKPLIAERKAGIKAADAALVEALRIKYRVDEDEVQAIIDDHKTRMNIFDARKKKERKQLENEMSLRLAERMKMLDEPPADDTFQEALKDRQDHVIKELLTVQSDLDEEAQKKILLQHEQNVRALDNQIAMSKMKQQQMMEARLAQKRAKLAQIEEQKVRAEREGQTKELEKLEKQLADEAKAFDEEREKAESEMRRRLQAEADAAMQAQEKEMSKLIGRLQVGKARRQAILTQQDKTLKGLQDRLANEGSINVPEQLLQQHYNDLAYLQQRIQSDRMQQEAHIKDQIEAKKYKRAREIEAKLSASRREAGSSASTAAFSRLMMEQQHRKVMDDMEREMKLELQKQKVEMDREFEKELQDSLNDLNANLMMQLAAVSNMSKDDVKQMVDAAVAETGGDAKKAKSLARRMTLGMERAKTTLGAVSKMRRAKGGRSKSSLAFQNRAYSDDEVDEDDRVARGRRRPAYSDDDDEDDDDDRPSRGRRAFQDDDDDEY